MQQLMECIPNISEGRNPEVIEACLNAVRSVQNVTLLDHSSDPSHNRTVITFLGAPEAVIDAAFALAREAVARIDLTVHSGEHPRMGAVDVIPFVPVKGITTEECVAHSLTLAARLADELSLPVFLYENSASAPHRKNLAAIRKGQFEGMAEKVLKERWHPDFGGNRIHPTAGVVAVGARPPLVAYNVNLNTSDITVADRIAKIVRESSGGLKAVKAIGVMLEDRNLAQVSMNLCDYKQTPLYRVTELIRVEAARYGVSIAGTEIIGLAPMDALIESAQYYLQTELFDPETQVLEKRLL